MDNASQDINNKTGTLKAPFIQVIICIFAQESISSVLYQTIKSFGVVN